MANCVRCCCWLLVLMLMALAITAAVVFVRYKNGEGVFPFPGVPGAVDHKYADALAVALQFFQVQKCKELFSTLHAFFFFLRLISIMEVLDR